jgi:hypothetical protein
MDNNVKMIDIKTQEDIHLRKQVSCIRCGIRLHPTDWAILKYNNQMPICDDCDIKCNNEKKRDLNNIRFKKSMNTSN